VTYKLSKTSRSDYKHVTSWRKVLSAERAKNKDQETIDMLPPYLRGLPSNRHGGQQLRRMRGFRGGKYGAAGPARQLEGDEKEAAINELKKKGYLD
jgi:hypothetical protein